MGRQGVVLGRKAKGKSLGKHKAIDRWLDMGRASERGASSREPGFIDGESRVKAVSRGEAKRISDMGFGIQVGASRARLGHRRDPCEIDAARIDYRKLEQATRRQGFDIGEAGRDILR